MLEKMGSFFDCRLDGYDEHQLTCIDGAREFYPFTSSLLPKEAGARVLDLGCGTGLELERYFFENPTAHVTGIDLAPGMLGALSAKFPHRALTLICGSYFDADFGTVPFDAAVSVESLHHFTKEEKIPLYEKVRRSLKPDGFFVLTDYFSLTDEEEQMHRAAFLRLKKEQGIADSDFYHYDTPLTVAHEIEALTKGGFSSVETVRAWGATHTLIARA